MITLTPVNITDEIVVDERDNVVLFSHHEKLHYPILVLAVHGAHTLLRTMETYRCAIAFVLVCLKLASGKDISLRYSKTKCKAAQPQKLI